MFEKLFSKKEEVKEQPVMQIADKLTRQDYKVMFGENDIGVIQLSGDGKEWVFICFDDGCTRFTADEIYQIYDRINDLNCYL